MIDLYDRGDDGDDFPSVTGCECGGYVVLEGEGASHHDPHCERG